VKTRNYILHVSRRARGLPEGLAAELMAERVAQRLTEPDLLTWERETLEGLRVRLERRA
jgi:hypothetical protein